jgi:hypothetical protein
MHLIHNKTLELHECLVAGAEPYAILSHTWGEGEVSLQEMRAGNSRTKTGYEKIRRCCEMAATDGFEYSWVDTCCIDKTSSAELSEAINSMYQWYEAAGVCYAYLADVPTGLDPESTSQAIRRSRWFTRGWTLQELIAPESVIFFDNQWKELGTKYSMQGLVSDITTIQREALQFSNHVMGFSVAQRMSWASMRETTRVEDLAYCLMGLFRVNMPMLYGEGSRAFIRLQEEILKTTPDHSILAWKNGDSQHSWGVLASSPAYFSQCHDIIRVDNPSSSPLSSTSKGIHLHVRTKPLTKSQFQGVGTGSEILQAVLDCRKEADKDTLLTIYLKESPQAVHGHGLQRVISNQMGELRKAAVYKLEAKDLFVRQQPVYSRQPSHARLYLTTAKLKGTGFLLKETYVYPEWHELSLLNQVLKLPVDFASSLYAGFRFEDENSNGFIVQFDIGSRACYVNAQVLELTSQSWEERHYHTVASRLVDYSRRPNSDRVYWQHPITKLGISVSIRRTIVSEKRAKTISISCHPPSEVSANLLSVSEV